MPITNLSGEKTLVQWVNIQSGGVMTTSTAIPYDDTIPQKTEGMQVMAVTITPKSASNTLIIGTIAMLSVSTASQVCITALFQDSTTGALAAMSGTPPINGTACIKMTHKMTAGTTSATTFKVRAGATTNTVTFNGGQGSRLFGGVVASSMTIYEVR